MGSSPNAACAACKFQRRKCAAECPLAPWFPPDQPKRFANVHRLFGVANVLKLFRGNPGKIEDLVKSICYEADARERDPVNGAYGQLQVLTQQAAALDNERTQLSDTLSIMLREEVAQNRNTEAVYLPSGSSNPPYDFTSPALGAVTYNNFNSYSVGGHRTLGPGSNSNAFAQQQQAHYSMHMGGEIISSAPFMYSGGGGYPPPYAQQHQQGFSHQQTYSQKALSSAIRRTNSDLPFDSDNDHLRDFLSLRNNNTHRGLF